MNSMICTSSFTHFSYCPLIQLREPSDAHRETLCGKRDDLL